MGVIELPQGILLLGKRKPSNSSQTDLWFCLVLLLIGVNHILCTLFVIIKGKYDLRPDRISWESCGFSFWYLKEPAPFFRADAEPKMDFKNKKKKKKKQTQMTYLATFNTWESRDNELVTSSVTGNRQSCRGYNDHVSELTSLWHVCMKSAFPAGSRKKNPVFGYHLFSIMTISIFCQHSSEMSLFYYKPLFHMTAFFIPPKYSRNCYQPCIYFSPLLVKTAMNCLSWC